MGPEERAVRRSIHAVAPGALLLVNGLAFNPWSVGRLFAPDRHLEGTVSLVLVVLFEAALVSAGARILCRPPRWTEPVARFTALSLVGLVAAAVLGLYGSFLAFRPPRWQAKGLSMVERLEAISQDTTFYKLEAERRTWKYRLERLWLGALRHLGREDHPFAIDSSMSDALYHLQRGETEKTIDVLKRLRTLSGERDLPREQRAAVRNLLAIAYLRLGEQQNCLEGHNPYACYLPLPPAGVHRREQGSRAAIAELESALADDPEDLASRWLLNIAYMTIGEYPDGVPRAWLIPEESFQPESVVSRFHDVAPGLGVDELSLSGGSIIEDFDNDGYLDLMASGTGLKEQLRYFHNEGDGTFRDATERSGLVGQFGGLNIVHADYDNDGYADVLVLRGGWMTFDSGDGNHPNSLLHNEGNGTFRDVTEEAGLLGYHPTQAAAWGDFDNDGWVDLFIGNESWDNQTHPPELFRNNGDGTFTDVAASAGVTAHGYIKGAAWGDFDNDGLIDLYLSRIGQPNVMYRNEGRSPDGGGWSFSDVTAEAGVAEPRFSFATWFWDFDNDGWLDLFVAGFGGSFAGADSDSLYDTSAVDRDLLGDVAASYLGLPPKHSESARLFRNQGNGTFADVTAEARLDRAFYVMGANYGDVDNDGYDDLYLGTGTASYRSLMPNRLFRSEGGRVFLDATTSAGVGHLQKGHGVSFGDVDNDGDQDIYAEMGGWFAGDVFRNVLFENPGHGRHWMTLRLRGVSSNRSAIGARVTVRIRAGAERREIHRVVSTGGSFGASSLQQEIGLGDAARVEEIEIFWPATGRVQLFRDVPADRVFEITEGTPGVVPVGARALDLSPGEPEEGQALHGTGMP